MRRSLQRRLSLALAFAIVLTGLIAAVTSFGLGYFEAQELQDESLRQIAALVARRAADAGFKEAPSPDGASGDNESRVVVMGLPGDARPAWLPENILPGFHTLDDGPERMRVLVRRLPQNARVVVAQPTDLRNEIALNSALRTLVPLILLLPLLAWLTARIVATELAPVRRMAHRLDGQAPDRPAALSETDVPDEIVSFIHAINRLLERVSQLMNEQRRFIADAAHELRSPLTALSIQAQNLENAESREASKDRLTALRAGIDRAQRLAEQLLSLAKTQTGTTEQAMIDVSAIVRELIAEYLPVAEARGIDLGMEEVAKPSLSGSPDTLRLILGNALDNALRYIPSGGEVTVRLAAEGDDAVIEVADTGPGIPASERTRVFDPFYRLEGSSGNGSGLGLAIARDAASRLGGSVILQDRPEGTGLVFRYRQRRADAN